MGTIFAISSCLTGGEIIPTFMELHSRWDKQLEVLDYILRVTNNSRWNLWSRLSFLSFFHVIEQSIPKCIDIQMCFLPIPITYVNEKWKYFNQFLFISRCFYWFLQFFISFHSFESGFWFASDLEMFLLLIVWRVKRIYLYLVS